MKIDNVYITSFGGIKDKKIEFEDGINLIYAENERGKSTLAEFIKTMLFGHGKAPQSIRENSRKRYLPWDGGKMSGEIKVSHNGSSYLISRIFGSTKSGDKVTATDSLSGSKAESLCTEEPGKILCGVSREGFEKSLYIKQLSTYVSADRDDEILRMLTNLSQTGDEDLSYQQAAGIIDSQLKEINGTRPKGKIPLLQEEISQLYSKKSAEQQKNREKEELKRLISSLESEAGVLKTKKYDKSTVKNLIQLYSEVKHDMAAGQREYETNILKSKKLYTVQAVLAVILCIWMFFAFKPAIAAGLLWLGFSIFKIFKKRGEFEYTSEKLSKLYASLGVSHPEQLEKAIENAEEQLEQKQQADNKRLLEIAEKSGDLNAKLNLLSADGSDSIDGQIEELNKQILQYRAVADDLTFAREALDKAFYQLQKDFSPKLNKSASLILEKITDGRYSEVLINEQYDMQVRRKQDNLLHDAGFLSNGAYDQIYLSLRLAIIELLFAGMPIILDDAFTQYDNRRLELALSYLASLDSQILLFTCHEREGKVLDNLGIKYNNIKLLT